MKLTGRNAQFQLVTLAVIKPRNIVVTRAGGGFSITGDIPQTKAGNKPFGGEHFTAQVNVDNVPDLGYCLSGLNNVDHIDFSSAGGSQFTIS